MHSSTLAKKLVVHSEGRKEARGVLRLYLSYRLALAVVLVLFLLTDTGPAVLGSVVPQIYNPAVFLYLAFTLLSYSLCRWNVASAEIEYIFAIFVDSATIALLMSGSGGPSTGLGMLLGISIAVGSLGMSGRTALLSAAFASVAILTESLVSVNTGIRLESSYTQLGLLGLSYFALALLAHQLSTRAAESELLARQRGIDLANLTELNEYIIQQMQTGVMVLDPNREIRLMNDAAWSLLGMPESTLGKALSSCSMPLFNIFQTWQAAPGGRRYSFDANPGGRGLQASFTSLGHAGDQGTLVFVEDMAAVAEHAQQIKLASLGRLAASIAHEIRNPLGAISHAAQLLDESENLQGTDRRMTTIITNNSKRLNEVIENILALSRRAPPRPEPLYLQPWLRMQANEQLKNHKLREEQLTLFVNPQSACLNVDKTQLSQIIATLIDNSVDHYPDNRSMLKLKLVTDINQESGILSLEITDNGPGIPKEAVEKIFDPFFTTRNNGTGLGLYICRELCEANNIRIEYLPIRIGGSCFKLSFPSHKCKDQVA